MHWPGGLPVGPPLRFGLDDALILHEWTESVWWTSDFEAGRLVDTRAGRPTSSTVLDGSMLLPVRWRGRRLLLEPTEGSFRDPRTGQEIERWTPPADGARHWVLLGGNFRASVIAVNGDRMSYLVPDSDAADGWRTVAVLDHGGDRFSQVGSGDSALIVPGGRPVMAIDAIAQQALVRPEGLPLRIDGDTGLEGFVFRAGIGLAVLAQLGRITAWSMTAEAGDPVWERTIGWPVNGIWADPAGERLAIVTTMGELWLLDFRTGEVLARAPLTERLRGTRFSRDCGFDDETLATVVRLGGIVVD
ncbi:hypothetical protein [Kitasatospora sp. NPDC059673]|uniref:hypothetical protein n=1 Tax=Kitasatospora sp. NPDC059673 TaxID=3346901 RepID=UPI00368E9EB6